MCIKTFFQKCENLKGFKKYATAFLLGAALTFTLAPIGFFPLLFVVVPAFAILARNAPTRGKSFAIGWAFGAGYFIFGLYWVSAALFVDIGEWGWVLPLSLVAGPAVLALYYGFIPLIAHRFKSDVAAHALAMAAAWSLVEYARGHLFTGFPWNMPGYAWDWALPVMQTAALAGIYGLTLLTLCWAMLPLLGGHKTLRHVVLLSFIAAIACGALRIAVHETKPAGDNIVRVVQANIPQANKWNKDEDWRNFEKHLKLSSAPAKLQNGTVTFVVWPETSVQADLGQFPEIARLIAMNLPPDATGLLGSMRVIDALLPQDMKFFNSVTVLDKRAKVLGNYDKHHLVPFGEYIPFRDKLNLTPIALAIAGVGDFARGPGPQTLSAGDSLPGFSPLVCYEAIFPGQVADRNNRPGFLVNVTNDAWYLKTAGPHQHLALTRLRAVEEGLPLVRAANTGISAVFDPVGRVLAKQPLYTSGYIDSILPQALPPTLYVRFGDWTFFGLLLLVAGVAFRLRRANS